MNDDRIGSTVRVIEGDGRTKDFKQHFKKVLPKGASDDIAVTVATELAAKFELSKKASDGDLEEKLVAGILTSAGFRIDDFYGQEAWLCKSDVEGLTLFVRGAPDPHFVMISGQEMTVTFADELTSEMPVEVGIASDDDEGMNSCIAPCLEEGVRVLLEGMLPNPACDEVMTFNYEDLLQSRSKSSGPR